MNVSVKICLPDDESLIAMCSDKDEPCYFKAEQAEKTKKNNENYLDQIHQHYFLNRSSSSKKKKIIKNQQNFPLMNSNNMGNMGGNFMGYGNLSPYSMNNMALQNGVQQPMGLVNQQDVNPMLSNVSNFNNVNNVPNMQEGFQSTLNINSSTPNNLNPNTNSPVINSTPISQSPAAYKFRQTYPDQGSMNNNMGGGMNFGDQGGAQQGSANGFGEMSGRMNRNFDQPNQQSQPSFFKAVTTGAQPQFSSGAGGGSGGSNQNNQMGRQQQKQQMPQQQMPQQQMPQQQMPQQQNMGNYNNMSPEQYLNHQQQPQRPEQQGYQNRNPNNLRQYPFLKNGPLPSGYTQEDLMLKVSDQIDPTLQSAEIDSNPMKFYSNMNSVPQGRQQQPQNYGNQGFQGYQQPPNNNNYHNQMMSGGANMNNGFQNLYQQQQQQQNNYGAPQNAGGFMGGYNQGNQNGYMGGPQAQQGGGGNGNGGISFSPGFGF